MDHSYIQDLYYRLMHHTYDDTFLDSFFDVDYEEYRGEGKLTTERIDAIKQHRKICKHGSTILFAMLSVEDANEIFKYCNMTNEEADKYIFDEDLIKRTIAAFKSKSADDYMRRISYRIIKSTKFNNEKFTNIIAKLLHDDPDLFFHPKEMDTLAKGNGYWTEDDGVNIIMKKLYLEYKYINIYQDKKYLKDQLNNVLLCLKFECITFDETIRTNAIEDIEAMIKKYCSTPIVNK